MEYQEIRALVADYYDIQKVRIESHNRARAFRQGVSPQEKAETKELIGDSLKKIEKQIEKEISKWLKNQEVWNEWLKGVKGIGPILAGSIIANYGDMTRFATISKLWKYSGLAVNQNGQAQKKAKGEKLTFNPRVKVMVWKIGEAFIKTKGGYRELYGKFREEYDQKWKTPEDCKSVGCKSKGKGSCLKGHRYQASKRKTVKVFLAHYFQMSQRLRGEEVQNVFAIGRVFNDVSHEHAIPIIYK